MGLLTWWWSFLHFLLDRVHSACFVNHLEQLHSRGIHFPFSHLVPVLKETLFMGLATLGVVLHLSPPPTHTQVAWNVSC